MRVAIDARFYGLEHSGLGRYTINLIRQLQNIDKKNKYYVLLRKKYYHALKFPDKWEKVLFDIPHYTIREQFALPRILKKINPDIFHALSVNYPVFHKGKTIITLHDLTQLSYSKKATTLPGPLYLFKHLNLKFIVKKALTCAEKVIVPSKAVGKDLIDIHNIDKKKLKVTYEGVSMNISTVAQNKIPNKFMIKNKYFLYVGNAYPHKNLDRLIEAVKVMNENTDENILLVLGGSRDIFQKRLENSLTNNEYEQNIRTIGYIPDEYMKYLYEKSVGFVYPSLSEGFGLQGIEAMRAGTLLIASDIPVFKEIYQENALYFNPYDFSKIADILNEVLAISDETRKKRIKKAQKFSERYSWRKMAEKTLEVYKSVN
jgi:glycosyltransferase involved in cell wall biosynthesis